MLAAMASTTHAQETVRLYAAGSLRAVMTEIGAAFTRSTGVTVAGEFGPSGLLRDRIVKGEPADLFASANMEHPGALAGKGRAAPVVLFARNRLCALVAPGTRVTSASLLDRMLDPAIKLGISTPKADPSGDYALQLFEKADKVRAGANSVLTANALKLTGGPDSPSAPAGRSIYGMVVAGGKADVFLTYCTNALQAKREEPTLEVVGVPDALAVGANYGMTVIDRAGPHAARLANFVMSVGAQEILARHGFSAVALP
jgi:ABC-type molybdate transport system substrate-binding protein